MRTFHGIDLASDPVPDANTLLKFHPLLEDLTGALGILWSHFAQ